MVKHVIIWTLAPDLGEDKKVKIKKEAKSALESLIGKIDGLLDIKLNTDMLSSSSGEMMLDSTFTDEDALKAYQIHPLHKAAADAYIRPYTNTKLCCDYEI